MERNLPSELVVVEFHREQQVLYRHFTCMDGRPCANVETDAEWAWWQQGIVMVADDPSHEDFNAQDGGHDVAGPITKMQ